MPHNARAPVLSLCLLAVACLAPRLAAQAAGAGADTLSPYRQELLQMLEQDQALRQELTRLVSSRDTSAFRKLSLRMDSADRAHTARLKELIHTYGWPDVGRVGHGAATAAFTLVQHADADRAFQREYLAYLERAFAAGTVPGEAVALLTDRLLVGQGKPQTYGTQASIRDGKLAFYPIADSARVDERRAHMKMNSLAEYAQQLRAAYHLRP